MFPLKFLAKIKPKINNTKIPKNVEIRFVYFGICFINIFSNGFEKLCSLYKKYLENLSFFKSMLTLIFKCRKIKETYSRIYSLFNKTNVEYFSYYESEIPNLEHP